MKLVLTAAFLLCAALGWSESLALTVHYDNGDPGEERTVWTTEYFVDDQGRLARSRRVIKGHFDDPDFVIDQVIHWEASRVWWEETSPDAVTRGEITFSGSRLNYSRTSKYTDPKRSDWTLTRTVERIPGPGFQWRDEHLDHSWSLEAGYNEKARSGVSQAEAYVRYTTKEGTVTEWVNGHPSDDTLLKRTSEALEGTFLGDFLPNSGSIVTGEIQLKGSGLYQNDPKLRLVLVVVLETSHDFPFVVPFVLENQYLR